MISISEKEEWCEPELQAEIEDMINFRREFKPMQYREALRKLWKEYKGVCKASSRIDKIRDEVVEKLQSW